MKSIGILLFDDVELLDFAGPYEVFTVTNELNDYSLFKTYTVSESGKSIKSVNGLIILPDFSVLNCPQADILVIPGGIGTKQILNNSYLLQWIEKAIEKSTITFSVCSGARVLAKLGLLDNKEFITHHEVIDDVLKIAPKSIVNTKKRFIDNGKIMTSAGISAGIDLSLYIVEKSFGKHVMDKTIKYMEYPKTE